MELEGTRHKLQAGLNVDFAKLPHHAITPQQLGVAVAGRAELQRQYDKL